MKRDIKLNKVIPFICIICFILIAFFVVIKESLVIDEVGYKFVSSFISNVRTPIVKFITDFGSAKIIIPLCSLIMILFVIRRKPREALILGICVFLQGLLNLILKSIFRRKRPTIFVLIKQGGYSFPSGHTMASVTFYGYLIYLVYKNIKNKYVKWTFIIFLSLLIFMIAVSRIYLGVHYTSDVLGGFLLSIAFLIIYINIFD